MSTLSNLEKGLRAKEIDEFLYWLTQELLLVSDALVTDEESDKIGLDWKQPLEVFYKVDLHSTLMFIARNLLVDVDDCSLSDLDKRLNDYEHGAGIDLGYFILSCHLLGHAIIAKHSVELPFDGGVNTLIQEIASFYFALWVARRYFNINHMDINTAQDMLLANVDIVNNVETSRRDEFQGLCTKLTKTLIIYFMDNSAKNLS